MIPYFAISTQPTAYSPTKRNLVNSLTRQHTLLIAADINLVEFEAFDKSASSGEMDIDEENANRPAPKTRGRAKVGSETSPPKSSNAKLPKFEFRVAARPVGVICNEVSISGRGGHDSLAGKFSLQPGEGTSTIEIGVKQVGSNAEEEVYRVFVTKVGI